jgi:hypothetical protein
MPRLIRMDSTGHSQLAEWKAGDESAFEAAVEAFRRELDEGYIGVVDEGEGRATQVDSLPQEADLVIMRRPIAGG